MKGDGNDDVGGCLRHTLFPQIHFQSRLFYHSAHCVCRSISALRLLALLVQKYEYGRRSWTSLVYHSALCVCGSTLKGLLYLLYLLYWYKSTNTGISRLCCHSAHCDCRSIKALSLLALLVKKYRY